MHVHFDQRCYKKDILVIHLLLLYPSGPLLSKEKIYNIGSF